jgi:YidC/Oxa1 family membrane protein insertase
VIGYIFNLIFSFPIFNALIVLYRLFGDFGLSIIVLTLLIKLILFPLTLSQLKSMKATQALQPRMAEIRKKYAKDQAAQAQAMQELYKEYGINPLAGCLPLLIQLPVLYGLYEALRIGVGYGLKTTPEKLAAINSALYPFIHPFSTLPNIDLSWFAFLDPILHIHAVFSLANPDPTHVLPILAGIATFVQLRMSQSRAAATQTNSGNNSALDPTAQSMKMMQYIMPIFTVFIGWTFPAGLALYWTVSSIFQAVQQFFVTGWGALATKPDLSFLGIGNTNKASANTSTRTTSSANNNNSSNGKSNGSYKGNYTPEEEVDEPEEGDDGDGPIAQKVRVPQRENSGSNSSARRRQSSSSARRRSSNNKQRRNVSSR